MCLNKKKDYLNKHVLKVDLFDEVNKILFVKNYPVINFDFVIDFLIKGKNGLNFQLIRPIFYKINLPIY